jgi:flavin-binding protein dodecin
MAPVGRIVMIAPMSDNIYKSVEITGSSTSGVDDAIAKAIAKAAETVRNIDWFEVLEIRGHVQESRIQHTQVTLKIGFRLE